MINNRASAAFSLWDEDKSNIIESHSSFVIDDDNDEEEDDVDVVILVNRIEPELTAFPNSGITSEEKASPIVTSVCMDAKNT
mmetsp:Transcript_17168/g.22762  ORF Transcript_17168/g.22762 Transcript_17168/m.22762 type:complete len:82 (-) Transcript_17168:252-497(-)